MSLFAITLLNPAFLAGLAALAVPIILHLVHRLKARPVDFPDLRFLRRVDERISRRHRIQDWLLLLLRIAVIALLVLALAKPFWKPEALALGRGPSTAAVLIVDDSYSMQLARNGVAAFESARRSALQALALLGGNDEVAVLPLNRLPPEGRAALTRDRVAARETLAGLACSNGATHLAPALTRACELLAGSKAAYRDLYFFTDLQKSGWDGVLAGSEWSARLRDFGLILVDVGAATANNLAVADLQVASTHRIRGEPVRVAAVIENHGAAELVSTVSLSLDGRRLEGKPVTVPARGAAVVTLSAPCEGTGFHAGEVRLEEDALPTDNARWFTVEVRDRIRVLVVNGDPSSVPHLDGAFYLARALQPGAHAGQNRSIVETTVCGPGELGDYALEDFAAIVLVEVADLPRPRLAALDLYVRNGGGLLFVCGPAADPVTLSRVFGGLLPAPVMELRGEAANDEESARIGALDERHPIFASLLGADPPIRLAVARIRRSAVAAPPADAPDCRVLMRLTNGDPALVERPRGAGKVLLLTFPLSLAWSDFPLKVGYLPFVHNLVYYLSEEERDRKATPVGKPIRLAYPKGAHVESVTLAREGAAAEEEKPQAEASGPVVVFGPRADPGIYEVTESLPEGPRESLLAVNVDSTESDLARIDPAVVEKALHPARFLYVARAEDVAAAVSRERRGLELSGFLALLALAALLLEGMVANRVAFGRFWATPAGRAGAVLLGLRVLAVLCLLVFLWRPVWSVTVRDRRDARIPVLVDVSRSMALDDAPGGAKRLDAALRVLDDPSTGILRELAKIAEVRPYAFGGEAVPCALEALEKGTLAATADRTDLKRALESAVEAEGADRIEAVVLLTDGQENAPGSAETAARALGVPVHCIGVGASGKGRELRDLAITRVEADRQALLNSRITVRAGISCAGWDELPRTVSVRRNGAVLAQVDAPLRAGGNDVQLDFVAAETGTFEYELFVEPADGERLRENNARTFVVTVSAEKIAALYYETTLRWEYKFVRQVLRKDPAVLFSGLVKTNPDRLYRQGAASGLPSTRDSFKKLEVLILGDVGRQDLSAAEMALLKQYVADDGGGLLIIGGPRVLGPDGLRGTPLEEALPLTLGKGDSLAGRFAPELTADGRAHPALAGLERFFTGAGCALDGIFPLGGPRPGAQVLVTAGADGKPLLAVQRYGAGRVALWASDADWRWAMPGRERGGEECLALLWGQLVRWLSGRRQAPRAETAGLVLTPEKETYRAGDTVRVRATGVAADDALRAKQEQSGTLRDPGGQTAPLVFAPGADRLEAAFRTLGGGEFTVKLALGGVEAERRIVVERDYQEMDRVALNEDLLRRVSGYSGGQYFTVASARTLPELLTAHSRLALKREDFGVDTNFGFFAFFLAVLTAEWVLRRRLQAV